MLFRFLLCIAAASGTEPECEKKLGVIRYSEWPVLDVFSRELTDNAVLVDIAYDGFVGGPRAALHDRHNKTYLNEVHPQYGTSTGPNNTRELVEISGLSVKDINVGWHYIVILTEDGSLWTAGRNNHGELSGDTVYRSTFTKVQGIPAVKEIAAAGIACVVLTEDGRLFSWGSDFDGVLGRLNVSSDGNPTPTEFTLGEGASLPTSVCCTAGCMALTNDAEVFTWGDEYRIARSGDHRVPGRVSDIPSGETIIKVACGSYHLLALSASGRLYGWGWNMHGELLLPVGTGTPNVTELDLGERVVRDVVAGRRITIVRTDADEVYYFGLYDDQSHTNATPLVGSLYPRDLMAKGRHGQDTFGAVSLGCDDSETTVTVGDAVTVASKSETAVKINLFLIWAMAIFIVIGN